MTVPSGNLQQTAWSDATAGLAGGEVDAALLRLPFPGLEGMRIEVLLTEPRWVVLAADHPLAVQEQIPFCQLWDEPFVAAPAETGPWRDYWLATTSATATRSASAPSPISPTPG